MKKIIIFGIIALGLIFTSCTNDDANADVDKLVASLNYFNDTFAELNEDGVISTEAAGGETSEYDKIRELANQYYDAINNVNKEIEKERIKAEKGKKIKDYEKAFEVAKQEKHSEIEKATETFINNLRKLEPEEQIDETEEVDETIETAED